MNGKLPEILTLPPNVVKTCRTIKDDIAVVRSSNGTIFIDAFDGRPKWYSPDTTEKLRNIIRFDLYEYYRYYSKTRLGVVRDFDIIDLAYVEKVDEQGDLFHYEPAGHEWRDDTAALCWGDLPQAVKEDWGSIHEWKLYARGKADAENGHQWRRMSKNVKLMQAGHVLNQIEGIEASYEYPEFLQVITGCKEIRFGYSNGPLGFDVGNWPDDGAMRDSGEEIPADSTPAQVINYVARVTERVIRNTPDNRVRRLQAIQQEIAHGKPTTTGL